MRYLITAAPDPNRPATEPAFDEALFVAHMKFNEEMHKAGVLVASLEGASFHRKESRR